MNDAGSLLRLLAYSRIRLNLILMATKFQTWLASTAVVGGIVFLMLRWIGWFQIRIAGWLLVSLGGGLAGLAGGWRRRLDNPAVARWLDEHLKSGETLSAALVCLERDCSGPFDGEILDAANATSEKPNQIKWPVRYLLKLTYLVAGSLILFTVGMIYLAPVFQGNVNGAFLKTVGVKKPAGEDSRRSDRLVVESPRTLARMLFPEDVKMSMLAERALREGDLPVLQDLLRDAELNTERQLPEIANSEEVNRFQKEVERRRQIMESLIAASEETNQGDSASEEGKENRASQLGKGEKEKGDGRKDNRLARGSGSRYDQSLQNETEAENYDFSDYLPGGNSNAGTGHNPNKGNWGTVAARTGKKAPLISKNKESQILEYILPGQNARLPLAQMIPASERASEAAIYREGIPYEYEEFIRNYFLLLSQETKGADLKEAQK